MTPEDQSRAEAEALDHARYIMWAYCDGMLRFDEQVIALKYVTDPASGRLFAAVPVAVTLAADHVLYVPEESDDALQLLLSCEECADCTTADRWQMYHGTPDHVRWAAFWVDGARHGPWVFDGDALAEPNALHHEEPALCKLANHDRVALARACQQHAGVVVPDPVCVGVSPRGFHVRARFGIVSVRFEPEGREAANPRAALERLLAP